VPNTLAYYNMEYSVYHCNGRLMSAPALLANIRLGRL
jgi:hypothetical protein